MLEWSTNRIKTHPGISENNKKNVLDFFQYCFSIGLSTERVKFYSDRLILLAQWIPDFKSATKEELQKVVAEKIERSKYAAWTKNIFKVTIKRFYKWLDNAEDFTPERIRWMKNPTPKNNKLPEELLTVEEVNKMIGKAENPRDKALISVLYESGCRVGELASLRIKHIVFDEYGAQIIVTGKTGMRRVRLLQSFRYLSYWLECHPYKDNPESSVWVRLTAKRRGEPLNYATWRIRLKKLAERAGIKKRVNPHSFRHARATHLARLNLNEAQMSAILGWVGGSDMPRTYIHLSGKDTDEALMKAYGLRPKENEDSTQTCPKCSKKNQITNKYCATCGMILNVNAAVEVEDKRAEFEEKIGKIMELLKEKDVEEFLADKLSVKRL